MQGDKDFVDFNREILNNMKKDVKLPDYESARVQGSRLLNRKDRYGIIGMDMKNGRVLARLGVIGALLEVSDAVEAAENSDEILYNVFLEAKRIDQTPNCTEDIKNAIMVTYIHEQVKPYISNSWFDGFMIMKFWHEWEKNSIKVTLNEMETDFSGDEVFIGRVIRIHRLSYVTDNYVMRKI